MAALAQLAEMAMVAEAKHSPTFSTSDAFSTAKQESYDFVDELDESPESTGRKRGPHPKDADELLEQQKRRKISHSAIERRRRQRINEKITQLQNLIPDCNGREGLQMAFVLQKAIEHIEKLHSELNSVRESQKINAQFSMVPMMYPQYMQSLPYVPSMHHSSSGQNSPLPQSPLMSPTIQAPRVPIMPINRTMTPNTPILPLPLVMNNHGTRTFAIDSIIHNGGNLVMK